MECRMDGRVALITGGSRGLGRAMAETFLKAGAKVAIVARRPAVLQEAVQDITAASDGAIKSYPGDVGKVADCQRVVDAAVADLGPIDILVTLLLDSRVLRDQELKERRQQRFASLADIVHELKEAQVDWELLLGNPPMRA